MATVKVMDVAAYIAILIESRPQNWSTLGKRQEARGKSWGKGNKEKGKSR